MWVYFSCIVGYNNLVQHSSLPKKKLLYIVWSMEYEIWYTTVQTVTQLPTCVHGLTPTSRLKGNMEQQQHSPFQGAVFLSSCFIKLLSGSLCVQEMRCHPIILDSVMRWQRWAYCRLREYPSPADCELCIVVLALCCWGGCWENLLAFCCLLYSMTNVWNLCHIFDLNKRNL